MGKTGLVFSLPLIGLLAPLILNGKSVSYIPEIRFLKKVFWTIVILLNIHLALLKKRIFKECIFVYLMWKHKLPLHILFLPEVRLN